MKSRITLDPISKPVALFETDGPQAGVDLAPSMQLPSRPWDEPDDTDFGSMYGVYYDDYSNLIPEYEDEIPDLENVPTPGEATPVSKISTDTKQSGHMGHLSLTSPHVSFMPEPSNLKLQVSTLRSGEVRMVHKVLPQLPRFEQAPPKQINIKELVSQVSRRVTQSVVGQLTELDPLDDEADIHIRRALAAARKMGPTATASNSDNIQAVLRAAKTRGLKVTPMDRTTMLATCGPPVALAQPQRE